MTEFVYLLCISGVLLVIRNSKSAIPGEVSYHLVFRADDGTQHVLQVDEQTTPATIDLQVGVEIRNCYILCSLSDLRERIIYPNQFQKIIGASASSLCRE